MSYIVPKRYGLYQIFVEPQKTTYGSCNFRYKLYMQNPVCDMIIFDEVKDLCFVDIAGIGKRVENPVGINRKTLSVALVYLDPKWVSPFAAPFSRLS